MMKKRYGTNTPKGGGHGNRERALKEAMRQRTYSRGKRKR
jgi:hypothetical protein